MQDIRVKIIKQRIVESNIFISENMTNEVEINMNCRVDLKTPKDMNEKSVLLNIELNIGTKGNELKIKMSADIIFELEKLLKDYNEIVEKKLMPMACKSLLNSLDGMLEIMGFNKMELANEVIM